MTEPNDDFILIPAKTRGQYGADEVVVAVYETKTHGHQLNIRIGKNLLDKMSLSGGDKIEFRYSIGKRQIKVSEGSAGYTLRADGSFRRNITGGFHQEPFAEKALASVSLGIVSSDAESIVLQVPEELQND